MKKYLLLATFLFLQTSQAQITNTAITFDGTNDYVSIGSPLLANASFTKEAWVYALGTNNYRNIISSFNHPFWIGDGTLYSGLGGNYYLVSSASFPANVWVHVVTTFDDATNTMKLYKNGVLVNTNTNVTAQYTAENILIGNHLNEDKSHITWLGSIVYGVFYGHIDEVRIWDTALSQRVIRDWMNRRVTIQHPNKTNLKWYSRLDDNTGTTASDIASTISGTGSASNGTLTNEITWVASTALVGPGRIACGYNHTISLGESDLHTWGLNSEGQLGDNTTTNRTAPVNITSSGTLSGKTVVAISGGGSHSIALASDGTLHSWGLNSSGQLGDNTTTQRNAPVDITSSGTLSGKTVVAISGGDYHSIALASDGTVHTWGLNSSGQLGDNTTTQRNAPVNITSSGTLSGKTVVAISAAALHSIALASDGTVHTWGRNTNGQLGDNSTTQRNAPVAVNTASGTSSLYGKTVVAIAGSGIHSIALASDGTLHTWGKNYFGSLGDNSTTDRTAPVAVNTASGTSSLYGKTVVAIAGGGDFHSIALASDGTLHTWGYGSSGQLGDNSTTQQIAPVQVKGVGGSGNLVLPVELKSFTANTLNENVILNWSTVTESANYGFDIERRAFTLRQAQNNNWIKLGFVKGSGTSSVENNYTYKDTRVNSGKYQYRLKQIDLDGTTEYSNQVEVQVGILKTRLRSHPNPFNPVTEVRYYLPEKTEVEITLFDIMGRRVGEVIKQSEQEEGEYEIKLNSSDYKLTSGIYFLTLKTNKDRITEKIVLLR